MKNTTLLATLNEELYWARLVCEDCVKHANGGARELLVTIGLFGYPLYSTGFFGWLSSVVGG